MRKFFKGVLIFLAVIVGLLLLVLWIFSDIKLPDWVGYGMAARLFAWMAQEAWQNYLVRFDRLHDKLDHQHAAVMHRLDTLQRQIIELEDRFR